MSRRSSSTSYSKFAKAWDALLDVMKSTMPGTISLRASAFTKTKGMSRSLSSFCIKLRVSTMRSLRAGLVPCHSNSSGE